MTEATIFAAALDRNDPLDRAAFLAEACGGDERLRRRVDALLKAHAEPDEILDAPPPQLQTIGFENISEKPGSMIGPYKLKEQIGEGGFGLVFVAEQQEPVKRKVALKLIKPGMDTREVLARFAAERQALALMDHPNIARVLDVGATESGRPYFVMELVRGVPITEYCDKNQLSPRDRLDLFITVCQAVQHAHQKGIIHRDIKPSNVLVTSHDGKPVVKVIDFGVAKAINQQLTERSIYTNFAQMIGTPLYMSPEQAEMSGLDIDTRSDIYSLGVLLYELLTGTTPFDKNRFAQAACDEIRRMIREEDPPKPSTRVSTTDSIASIAAQRHMEPVKLSKLIRGDLDWITMKALEKDRTRRYETANGLARDIQRYLSSEPVDACPPSTAYRLRKFARKNRTVLMTATAIGLLLVAGVAVSVWQAVRAMRAEQLALQAQHAEAERAKGERLAKLDAQTKEKLAVELRTRAEQAADRTRTVLDAMTSSATGDSLSTQTEISAEQKNFLTEVLTYYRELANENGDDEQSRDRTANAAFRVAMIEYRLGRIEQGIEAFQLARDGFKTLAANFPAAHGYRHNLANCHNGMGHLLAKLMKRKEAEEQYRLALAIREQLAAEFPTVPVVQQHLAASYNNLGLLLNELGKQAEAEEKYYQALTIQEKLATDFPTVGIYRQQLAGSHNNLGLLLAGLEKRVEAEEQYRKALVIRENLVVDFPGVPSYRQTLASSYISLGLLLVKLGKRDDAEQQHRMALTIYEKLAADFPTVPDYRQRLASSQNNLASLLVGMEKRAEAEELYHRAIAILAKLAADFPTVPDYKQELARSHNGLGLLLAGLEKRTAAEEQYRKALAVHEKLVANFPAVPTYWNNLGANYCNFGNLVRDNGRASESLDWFNKAIAILAPNHRPELRESDATQFLRESYAGRAAAYDALTKHAEAVQDWDRAIELSSPAQQWEFRTSRATSRRQAGLVAEAIAEVDELTSPVAASVDSPQWTAVQWYNFACIYSAASKTDGLNPPARQQYADRAVELLHRAVEAGYNDAGHLEKDADLDPLRDRDDFQRILLELESKSESK